MVFVMDDCDLLTYFKDAYLSKYDNLKIINVGYSKTDYSSVFNESNWSYNILDSRNEFDEVNILVNDINYWVELPDESCEVIFSKDFFINLKYFWLVMFQIERKLKPNGLLCIIVPNLHSNIISSSSNIFTTESLKSLADYVNLDVCEIFEKNSEICLIAQKRSIAKQILSDSHEANVFKNNCDLASEKIDLELNKLIKINRDLDNSNNPKIKEINLELIGLLTETKHILFEFDSSKHVFCPICQSVHNIFSPFGSPSRLNAQCPNCNSLEKQRLIFLFLTNKTKLLSNEVKLLHFEPEESLYNFFKTLDNVDYLSVGKNLSFTVDNAIDFENMDFPENNFDIILLDYEILKDHEEDLFVLKNLYDVVKPQDEGGFILIHLQLSDYKNTDEFNNFEKQLKYAGFKITKYSSEDIIDNELMDIYGIISDFILICEKI